MQYAAFVCNRAPTQVIPGFFGWIAAGLMVLAFADQTMSVETASKATVAINDAHICLSPYSWKVSGEGVAVRAEATMPGAYFRTLFKESATIGVLIDGTGNRDCPPGSMPVVEYSIDGGAFKAVQLTNRDKVESLQLANNLNKAEQHRVDFYFRASCLGPDRWRSSAVHLRLAGIELDAGGSLVPCPIRPKRAIGFGDSITEGVCAEGLCPYYSNLMMNNARVTWFPLVCTALDCEYGQLGSGGQGMLKPMSLPPLPQSWDRYDENTSRLTNGLLLPEPDYIFCCMGTNDFQGDGPNRKHMDISAVYKDWLKSVRKACSKARVFCVTPPLGWHRKEVAAAVADRNQAGDARVYLIDTAPCQGGFGEKNSATQLAPDGCHPSVYGNAMLGTLIAVEAQKILCQEQAK